MELRPRCGKLHQRRRASGTRGVLEADERVTVRWHENEAKLSRKRHASVMGGVQGKGEGLEKSRRETTVDGKGRKEMEDRVARYQAD